MKYYLIDERNQQIGPFALEELKMKGINKKTKVWCEGMDDWTEAQLVSELKENIILPPPPPLSQNQINRESNQFPASSNEILPLNNLLIYTPSFDINSLSNTLIETCKKHSFKAQFSVGLGVFLHFITLGIFTTIHCGLMHSKLPKITIKDFSAGKAIGFLFIPIINVFWFYVFWEQLARRINFQYKLRNKPLPVSISLATWACVLQILIFIPYVGWVTYFVSFLFLFPLLFNQIRSACNQLAEEQLQQMIGQPLKKEEQQRRIIPVVPPPSPVPTKTKMRRLIFIFIGIILLLVITFFLKK